MSTLENETNFHKTNELHTNIDTHFNGSTEFILITDHQTTKSRSRELLDEHADDNESYCRSCMKNIFRKKILYKRLPILTWLPKYSGTDAIGDLIAGITVGLTVIPQGLAYSGVAGLPTQVGSLFSLNIIVVVFVFFIFCFHLDL